MPEESFVFRPGHIVLLRVLGIDFVAPPTGAFVDAEVAIEAPVKIAASVNLASRVRIGAFSHLNGGTLMAAEVGRYCSIAPGLVVGQAGHPTDRITVSPITWDRDFAGWRTFVAPRGPLPMTPVPAAGLRPLTHIGHDVWIGQNVFVKAGVTIGNGAVVAAGSVVVKDVAPYTIVGGAPARPIRDKVSPQVAARLEALAWWRYNLFESDIDMANVEASLDGLERLLGDGLLKPYQPPVFTRDTLATLR